MSAVVKTPECYPNEPGNKWLLALMASKPKELEPDHEHCPVGNHMPGALPLSSEQCYDNESINTRGFTLRRFTKVAGDG